jgi:hypothetical protein
MIPLRQTALLPGTLQNLYYPPPDYVYFDRSTAVPFSTAGPVAKAAWAADAAMLAYARYGQRRMTDAELNANFTRAGLQYQKIGGTAVDWNAPGTQAVFASNEDFAILAFRGTEADDPKDVLSDADLVMSVEHDYRPVANDPVPALGHLAFVTHLFAPPCLVHAGFQLALNQVWDQIHSVVMNYRANHPGVEICFTGHSLGGALAVLAFSRFSDHDISLYTFGCPRVGDGAFRDRTLSNPGRGIYRYVNYNDAVTHVPTESLLYKQTPTASYRFNANGELEAGGDTFEGDVDAMRAAIKGLPSSIKPGDLDNIAAPPSLVDHSPARYCFRLWDFV